VQGPFREVCSSRGGSPSSNLSQHERVASLYSSPIEVLRGQSAKLKGSNLHSPPTRLSVLLIAIFGSGGCGTSQQKRDNLTLLERGTVVI
jgi:hypothetical protein